MIPTQDMYAIYYAICATPPAVVAVMQIKSMYKARSMSKLFSIKEPGIWLLLSFVGVLILSMLSFMNALNINKTADQRPCVSVKQSDIHTQGDQSPAISGDNNDIKYNAK